MQKSLGGMLGSLGSLRNKVALEGMLGAQRCVQNESELSLTLWRHVLISWALFVYLSKTSLEACFDPLGRIDIRLMRNS